MNIITNKDRLHERSQDIELTPTNLKKMKALSKKMKHMIRERNTIAGLAAPQVGYDVRMVICDLMDGLQTMLNPEIDFISQETLVGYEGCLSCPDQMVAVPRYTKIVAKWYDADGLYHSKEYVGRDARVIQHEVDHLNGRIITDYKDKK